MPRLAQRRIVPPSIAKVSLDLYPAVGAPAFPFCSIRDFYLGRGRLRNLFGCSGQHLPSRQLSCIAI